MAESSFYCCYDKLKSICQKCDTQDTPLNIRKLYISATRAFIVYYVKGSCKTQIQIVEFKPNFYKTDIQNPKFKAFISILNDGRKLGGIEEFVLLNGMDGIALDGRELNISEVQKRYSGSKNVLASFPRFRIFAIATLKENYTIFKAQHLKSIVEKNIEDNEFFNCSEKLIINKDYMEGKLDGNSVDASRKDGCTIIEKLNSYINNGVENYKKSKKQYEIDKAIESDIKDLLKLHDDVAEKFNMAIDAMTRLANLTSKMNDTAKYFNEAGFRFSHLNSVNCSFYPIGKMKSEKKRIYAILDEKDGKSKKAHLEWNMKTMKSASYSYMMTMFNIYNDYFQGVKKNYPLVYVGIFTGHDIDEELRKDTGKSKFKVMLYYTQCPFLLFDTSLKNSDRLDNMVNSLALFKDVYKKLSESERQVTK